MSYGRKLLFFPENVERSGGLKALPCRG